MLTYFVDNRVQVKTKTSQKSNCSSIQAGKKERTVKASLFNVHTDHVTLESSPFLASSHSDAVFDELTARSTGNWMVTAV